MNETPENVDGSVPDSIDGAVSVPLVGEVWPTAQPGTDPVLYGHVELLDAGPVEVRSWSTFVLRYTVGRFGLDDTGAIRVVLRAMSDGRALQNDDPAAPNYMTAESSNGVPLRIGYDRRGRSARPRWKSITINVTGGYLSEGDVITLTLGDTSGGSPGWAVQTIAEPGFEFKVLADVCAVGHFIPIPDSPAVSIVPGPVERWVATLPTLRRVGEDFQLGLKAEDRWGNPTPQASGQLRLVSSLQVTGLPEQIAYEVGQRSRTFEGLRVADAGVLRITVVDENNEVVAETNPLVITEDETVSYWGDLHGQSGESVGLTTARQYFDFARNAAFLDVTGHQANDFQVNNAFWEHLNQLTAEYDEPGRFVAFPGYEWSGNTAVGGDRNVFFRNEGRQIRRSSHALLGDRSDIETDANDANQLFEDLHASGDDVVVYAHVGGRYADTALAHDRRLETAMEIHSAWGTFEWLLTDGFALGHRCGVVANSDGHKGRPGASYPGAATFGAYGGLTCFLTTELTRDAIFECLRRRHHYATTGGRLHLDVRASFSDAGLFERDPVAYPGTESTPVDEAIMGDIVETRDTETELTVTVEAGSPIERIEFRNGTEVVHTHRPFTDEDLGHRYRVLWSGAEYRGRGRESAWRGSATFDGAEIERFETINSWNHERLLQLSESAPTTTVDFDTITTGNYGGFDVWLADDASGEVVIETNHGTLRRDLSAIGIEAETLDAGGLERQVSIFGLPESNSARSCTVSVPMALRPDADNPLWVSVYTEDGFQAWSSPIFAIAPTG